MGCEPLRPPAGSLTTRGSDPVRCMPTRELDTPGGRGNLNPSL